MKTKFLALACAGVLVSLLTANAQPGWIQVSFPWASYGHVYNTDTGGAGGIGQNWCAPTATANSFVFLETQYPQVYHNWLTGGNPVTMRNSLANGWLSPGGLQRPGMIVGGGGSSFQSWWENKVWYIEDYAPNTTTFAGMVESDPTLWYRGGDLTRGSPTWGFLWRELSDGEDIEIGIDLGTSTGHALTLSSMKFQDGNSNGMWDPGEARQIDYVDPNNPMNTYWATVQPNLVGGRLQFWWNNGGANPAQWATIDLAYAESVPEPAALSLLAFGAAALMIFRRRQA